MIFTTRNLQRWGRETSPRQALELSLPQLGSSPTQLGSPFPSLLQRRQESLMLFPLSLYYLVH